MSNNISDFKEIVRKIESNKILLPDFQREFAWKDEERQKKIVASVLAKMPIGSILLLKSKPDEYSSKMIGCKTKVNVQDLDSEVEFLLDGQQRITVLTNVFSNVIHDHCNKVSDLISISLKRRFFLRIPRWSRCGDEEDWFGVYKLIFKYQNPDSEEPKFLSNDIYKYIECIDFTNGDKQPYNPQVALSTDLDNFCITHKEGYLIPLYLLTPSEKKNKSQITLRYNTILNHISRSIADEIINHFTSLRSAVEKKEFINEIFAEEDDRKDIKNDLNLFEVKIEERQQVWKVYLDEYLQACIKSVSLNRIVVKEDQRARAIDIYENLNRGGVSLNTFDLMMARVAKVSKDNFYQRIVKYMKLPKKYSKNVLPDVLEAVLSNKIDDSIYNATISTNCYNENKNEITPKYIDAFLDVLSLYCYNKSFNADEFKLEYIKRDQILKLDPEEIDENCEQICKALDRALFFFQTRCGIRSIQEINYSLMLVLVAAVFVKDEYFASKKVHDVLEAWYWASLFSGSYDKDQNMIMIDHLKFMTCTLQNSRTVDWIRKLKEDVLERQYFSEKSFLLMEKSDEERYPKSVIKNFMCQYLLSKTYADVFDSNKRVSVFSEEAGELEAHHIIPLGTVKKINESTTQLRKNTKHICNSPLNFVYITKTANKMISDDSLDTYITRICIEAKSSLFINNYTNKSTSDTDNKIKALLEIRYDCLKGDIKQHITDLLL